MFTIPLTRPTPTTILLSPTYNAAFIALAKQHHGSYTPAGWTFNTPNDTQILNECTQRGWKVLNSVPEKTWKVELFTKEEYERRERMKVSEKERDRTRKRKREDTVEKQQKGGENQEEEDHVEEIGASQGAHSQTATEDTDTRPTISSQEVICIDDEYDDRQRDSQNTSMQASQEKDNLLSSKDADEEEDYVIQSTFSAELNKLYKAAGATCNWDSGVDAKPVFKYWSISPELKSKLTIALDSLPMKVKLIDWTPQKIVPIPTETSAAIDEAASPLQREVNLEIVLPDHLKLSGRFDSRVIRSLEGFEAEKRHNDYVVELRHYSALLHEISGCIKTHLSSPLHALLLKKYSKTRPTDTIRNGAGLDIHYPSGAYDYQRSGINTAINELNGRVLWCDDMGLGKSMQALTVANAYGGITLIVCPACVIGNWELEIIRWLNLEKSEVVRVPEAITQKHKVVLVSYGMLEKMPADNRWNVILVDESHYMKSSKTKRCRILTPLLKRAKCVLLLSGTPAVNRPSDLYTQLHALHPQLFPREYDFQELYCKPKMTRFGRKADGQDRPEELAWILKETCLIRRLKKDVMTSLPEKVRERMTIECPRMPIRHDDSGDQESRLKNQYTDSAAHKLPHIISYLEETLADITATQKVLIFAHHQVILDGLEALCTKLKLKCVRIDGATAIPKRSSMISEFQNSPGTKVAILGLTSMGVGVTLHSASYVIMAELYWTPAVMLQAEDRAHRVGQRNNVTIHYLIATNTADEQIWGLLQRKLTVLGKALDESDAMKKGLQATRLNQDITNRHVHSSQERDKEGRAIIDLYDDDSD